MTRIVLLKGSIIRYRICALFLVHMRSSWLAVGRNNWPLWVECHKRTWMDHTSSQSVALQSSMRTGGIRRCCCRWLVNEHRRWFQAQLFSALQRANNTTRSLFLIIIIKHKKQAKKIKNSIECRRRRHRKRAHQEEELSLRTTESETREHNRIVWVSVTNITPTKSVFY